MLSTSWERVMNKCQNSCPHVTYNLAVRGQIVLSRGIYYGENLESKRMKSYWDQEGVISYKAGYRKTTELTVKQKPEGSKGRLAMGLGGGTLKKRAI